MGSWPFRYRASRGGQLRRTAWLLLRVTAIVHLAMQLLVFLPTHWQRTDVNRDVSYLYVAAERVRTGQPLYWPWPDYGPHVHTELGPPYTYDRHPYPPFLATALAPATALPFTTFARLWYLPLLAAFWTYAWCLARLAIPQATGSTGWGVLVAGQVLTLFPGSYRALSLGQIDPILWALFGLALVIPAVRGVAFAASAAVKLYAGWPLLFAIRREGLRVLVQAAAVLLVGVLASSLALGSHVFLDWARYMLPVVSQGSFNADNISLSFAGLRLARLFGWDYVPGPLPGGARLYLTLMGIGAPLVTGWLARRMLPNLQYACIGAAAVLFAPLCWSSYLPLLLLPIAAWVGTRRRTAEPGPVGGGRATAPVDIG